MVVVLRPRHLRPDDADQYGDADGVEVQRTHEEDSDADCNGEAQAGRGKHTARETLEAISF